jgi:arylsulfatase A-like enzyme
LVLGIVLLSGVWLFARHTFKASRRTRDRLNLVLVTLDTFRADHLGAYGYPDLISPNLDRFAESAVVFENAISTAPLTGPSHASILTSQHPSTHGIVFNGNRLPKRLASKHRSIAEHLSEAGYVTAGFVSTGCLYAKYGFSRRFEEFHQLREEGNRYVSKTGLKDSGCWGRHTTRAVADFLKRRRDEPFFVWAHYYDAHSPYVSPPDIWRKLGLDYAEVLHVPMMIHWPGLDGAMCRSDFVSTIDLAPTLLGLLKQPPLPSAAGLDLFAPKAAGQGRPLFAEWRDYYLLDEYDKPVEDHFFPAGVQSAEQKLIRSFSAPGREMLFDLSSDPREERDLTKSESELKDRLERILDEHIQNDLPNGLIGAQGAQFDPETIEMLRSLGYIE